MNNEIERYVGELRDLRRIHHTIFKNKETIQKWINWLESDIRHRVFAEWEKQNKRELKDLLDQLLTAHDMVHTDDDQVRVSGVPYTVIKENIS